MSVDATAVLWQHEMQSIDQRLARVLWHVVEILAWSDSEARLLDASLWPRPPSWFTRHDDELVNEVIPGWLNAVNSSLQPEIRRAKSQDEAEKVMADGVVEMRPLKREEREALTTELKSDLEDRSDAMRPVRMRLANLQRLHAEMAGKMPTDGSWSFLRRDQEREAKRRFPLAIDADHRLLRSFVKWREAIHDDLMVQPLSHVSNANLQKQEFLEWYFQTLREIDRDEPKSNGPGS